MLGLADQTALANDECGPAPASGGTIVCNPSNYDPATDGNIVYQLEGDDDYKIEFRNLKGAEGIVINDSDSPHSYFTSRPNGVWIDHRGPGNLSAFVSGIELTTTEADAGSASARGFNLTLWSGNDNDATTTDRTDAAAISLMRRDLVLTVEKSIFNTYARALTGVHIGTGDVTIDAADLQITTTGPSGHGIVGWHDANGNVSVNAERVKIVTPQGYAVGGFVWNNIKFNRVPDPGDKTLSLRVRDSEIRAGLYGLYAQHRGSGKSDLLLSNSSITTEGANGYGIFTRNATRNASDNLDISVNVVNSKITTAGAGAHGILIFRQENPNSMGTNRITMDSTSQIETGDAGHGIWAQGKSDITADGRITAGSGGHGIFVQGESDITVGGRITASGGGHGVHVDGTSSTGTNTIRINAGSRIEVEGDGYGIRTQGKSIITIEGQVTAESGTAVSNSGGDLDVILRGNPVVEGQILNEDGHMINMEVNGEKLVGDGQIIRRTGPTPGAYDMAVSVSDDGGFQFDREFGPRAFVYESLPETLHTLNRLSTRQERGRAISQAEPFWMRAEGSRATREPTDSTTGTDWQMERWILQAGYGFLVGESLEAGVSVHYGDASTDISGATELGGGEIDTESYGLGASLIWRLQNGVYLDVQGVANWYDSDLSGTDRGTLKSGVDGTGWALALEAGYRLEMTELTVTPHIRVAYSEVDPDSFVDKFGGHVSSDTDDRTTGGLGVTFEGSRGWVLAEFQREFGTGTSVDVAGTSLDQRMARARVRLAMGGEMSVLQDKLTLRGELGAASDISSSAEDTEVKAGITAHMSF